MDATKRKGYLIVVRYGYDDVEFKVVDKETWRWVKLAKAGKPKGLKKSESWDDQLCPPTIRQRIWAERRQDAIVLLGRSPRSSRLTPTWQEEKVLLRPGNWGADRANQAPLMDGMESVTSITDLFRRVSAAGIELVDEAEVSGW